MPRHAIANIATAAFFFLLAGLIFVAFLLGLGWTSILFAIFLAGLGYRILWGMQHGED